ncbi:phosphate-starvation-inducible PsiE family protein [Caldovatus sp. SYSU G05006]|uniref:Phosphate-starvation-inducible PsiE family protein n=2 Tax=Caldovatus aquaticus TaxID=2865671 RepID=A0ABS7F1Y8_9PROT|nr:phosphate-starvation-inducible PsiE family protein [Caldovatus aquaticus]
MQANRDAASIPAPPASAPEGAARRWPDAAATSLRQTREAWPGLTGYERFEQVAVLVISALVSVVIAAALIHLAINIVLLVLYNLADPADQAVFQAVFGMVMTVLIALEFNHTILGVLQRRHGIVQLRTVVLIALLALVRKFIILDAAHTAPLTIIGLAASVLALGAVYWLVRDQDRREAEPEPARDSGGASA